jgi:hypothetical protein
MINQEYAQTLNNKFAEKCRKALEKSYGVAVPVPKTHYKKRELSVNNEQRKRKHPLTHNRIGLQQ